MEYEKEAIKKFIKKYKGETTLKEVLERLESEQDEYISKRQILVNDFIKRYKGKCIKVEDFSNEGSFNYYYIENIALPPYPGDMTNLCFIATTTKIDSYLARIWSNNEHFIMYSSQGYEIIPNEKFESIKNIILKYREEIK